MAERKPATKASPAKKTAAKKPVEKKPVESKPEVLVLMKNRKGDMMNVPSSKIGEYKSQGYMEV